MSVQEPEEKNLNLVIDNNNWIAIPILVSFFHKEKESLNFALNRCD